MKKDGYHIPLKEENLWIYETWAKVAWEIAEKRAKEKAAAQSGG